MSEQHIAVIGAGIVGVSAALHLQRDGVKGHADRRTQPGRGHFQGQRRRAGGGFLRTGGDARRALGRAEIPDGSPGPLAIRWSYLPKIAPWLLRFIAASKPERVEEISVALRSILIRATEVHRDIARAIGETSILRETGWLGVFESDKKFESYQWDLDLQKRRGVEFRVMAQEEIRQFEPSLQPIFRHAVYYPENPTSSTISAWCARSPPSSRRTAAAS